MKKIYLIYPRAYETAGSTQMRVFQLKQLLDEYGKNDFLVTLVPISNLRHPFFWNLWIRKFEKNSALIFCKNAIDRMPLKLLIELQSRGVTIALDYVDRIVDGIDIDLIDVHIASCQRQFEFLNRLNVKGKKLLLHHYGDLRIFKKKPINQKKIDKSYYLGEIQNLFLPEEFLSKIDIFKYNGILTNEMIDSAAKYKFQYCVRPKLQNESLNYFKPPTKIMNSIALGNLPIISADQSDAIQILGKDYPFVILKHNAEELSRVFDIMMNDHDTVQREVKRLEALRMNYLPNNFYANIHNSLLNLFPQ